GRVACQMQYPTQGALRRVVSGNKQGVFKPLVCHAANHLAPGCLEPAWTSRAVEGSRMSPVRLPTIVISLLFSLSLANAQNTDGRHVGYIIVLDLSGNLLADNPINSFDSEATCVRDLETSGSKVLHSIFRAATTAQHKFLNAHAIVIKDNDNYGNSRWSLMYVGCGTDRSYAPTLQNISTDMSTNFEALLDSAASFARQSAKREQ
ncbi:MAG TPA: hypothetical protein VMH86_17855, partial [Rhizomicrobium sp.]|nr:hypothetical protein [Rhizomicrobium sp.]